MKETKKAPRLKKQNTCQCPTREILDRIGDKWSILTIITLANAPKYKYRFSELQRNIEGISQRMLATTLRHLERDGFVKRYFYPEIPPRTEYELTSLGKSIFSTFQQLKTWIESNWLKIKSARDQFDAKKSS
jgi:DNA-binding HxlR family transcriptional regulator